MTNISDNIKVGIPIVVSILSLLFGAWQYFDKRGLQREIQKQQLKLNAADLIVNYLDTDIESIESQKDIVSGPNLVSDIIRCIDKIVEPLHEGYDLQLQLTAVLNDIDKSLQRETLGAIRPEFSERIKEAESPQLSFLLIRNSGRSNAVKVSLAYETLNGGEDLLIGVIEPNRGVLIPIMAYELSNMQPLSLEITPNLLRYTDASTGKTHEVKVRNKFKIPRFVTPQIRSLR